MKFRKHFERWKSAAMHDDPRWSFRLDKLGEKYWVIGSRCQADYPLYAIHESFTEADYRSCFDKFLRGPDWFRAEYVFTRLRRL